MLVRNYKVFTGTQLYNDFLLHEVNGRDLTKDGLCHMLFVASPTGEEVDGQQLLHGNSEIYGPFFMSTEADMWRHHLNRLFVELRRELGDGR